MSEQLENEGVVIVGFVILLHSLADGNEINPSVSQMRDSFLRPRAHRTDRLISQNSPPCMRTVMPVHIKRLLV